MSGQSALEKVLTARTNVVLRANTFQSLLNVVIQLGASRSTICICSSMPDFLDMLRREEQMIIGSTNTAQEARSRSTSSWLTPTPRLLQASNSIKLALCSDVTHLRAFLMSYGSNDSRSQASELMLRGEDRQPLLIVLNPIRLHRLTTGLSAQGLNRTFAAAAEAANECDSRLIVCELPSALSDEPTPDGTVITHVRSEETGADSNIWDTEVPMLNVTTKAFGVGEPGWVGRTIKIRTIAERWFTFVDA